MSETYQRLLLHHQKMQMIEQQRLHQLLMDMGNQFSMEDKFRPKNVVDADWRTIDGVKELEAESEP